MESSSRNGSQESFPVKISKQLKQLEPNVIELQNAKPKKMETTKQTLSLMILQVLLTLEIALMQCISEAKTLQTLYWVTVKDPPLCS